MAIYHFTSQTISRKDGRSATAAAAYRAGQRIEDRRTGVDHDYRRKSRGVLESMLILPGGGTADRAEFWNSIEVHHKRGDAVLAREFEISIPRELSAEARHHLVASYARELADRYGVAVDVSIHKPRYRRGGHAHNGNWHGHFMLSACRVSPDGKLGKKCEELDPIHCRRRGIENAMERERPIWEARANAALGHGGHAARIDHRSHAARGITVPPTRHLGPAACAYERRTGKASDKRIRDELEIAEALQAAKAAGELERELHELDRRILDLSGDLSAALAERDAQQRAASMRAQQSGPLRLSPAPLLRSGLLNQNQPPSATGQPSFNLAQWRVDGRPDNAPQRPRPKPE